MPSGGQRVWRHRLPMRLYDRILHQICQQSYLASLADRHTSRTDDEKSNLWIKCCQSYCAYNWHDILVEWDERSVLPISQPVFPKHCRRGLSWSEQTCPKPICCCAIKPVSIGWCHYEEVRTSEKAGAAIFLYFFHSSPSEATILWPKNVSALYWSTGLKKRDLEDIISYGCCYSLDSIQTAELTLITEASAISSVILLLGKAATYVLFSSPLTLWDNDMICTAPRRRCHNHNVHKLGIHYQIIVTNILGENWPWCLLRNR